jgi:hypothetical protein
MLGPGFKLGFFSDAAFGVKAHHPPAGIYTGGIITANRDVNRQLQSVLGVSTRLDSHTGSNKESSNTSKIVWIVPFGLLAILLVMLAIWVLA